MYILNKYVDKKVYDATRVIAKINMVYEYEHITYIKYVIQDVIHHKMRLKPH